MISRRASAFVAAALLAGCSPATITGSIGGDPVPTDDVVFVRTREGVGQRLIVTIGGPAEDLCQEATQGVARPLARHLVIDLAADHLDTGTFAIGPRVTATLMESDESCGESARRMAQAGSVVLTAIGDETVSGALRLEFDLDRLEGSFEARACNASAAAPNRCEPL